MHPSHRTLLALAVVAASALPARAQAVDPSGHWEGAIKAPNREISMHVDLEKKNDGKVVATFSNPAERLNGYPLTDVTIDGRTVRFVLKAGTGGGPFTGTLSEDAKSLSGEFVAATPQGTYALPFSLTRTGDARFVAPPRSAPIDKALEGSWTAALDVNGRQLRLALTMTNQADGTATGIFSVYDSVEIPIAIQQQASKVTIDVAVTGATYAATLDPEAGVLTGTWVQGPFSSPVTFRRAR